MSPLHGNAVAAQSDGATAVIHSSARGVLEEALRQRAASPQIFDANNGILGIVPEDCFDLGAVTTRACNN